MTIKLSTNRGRLTAQATPTVQARYDRQFNMIEVLEGKRVEAVNITPRGYTLDQFCDYIRKVQDIYNDHEKD